MRYTRLLTFATILSLSVMAAQAQDAVPTVAVGGSTGSNVPSVGTPQPIPTATPAAPAESSPGPQPTTGSSLTLSEGGSRICPAPVDYKAVPVVCGSLVTDEACIGQGTVSASPLVENANFSFSKPGDRTRLTDLSELNLQSLSTDSGTWTVVAANLTLNTNDPSLSAPAVATMLLIGDVSIANAGQQFSSGAATAQVLGTLGINVRKSPSGSAAAIYQLSPGEQVLATGRLDNTEGRWIRITIPTRFEGTAWVFGEYLKVTGDSDSLPVVKENSPVQASADQSAPEFGPMQSFNLLSGVTDSSCTGVPDSGILVQTPNGIAAGSGAKLRVNGVEIVLNGTAFIQAQPNVSLRVTVLEGDASVTANGSTQQAQSISQVAVAMGQNLEPTNAPTVVQADTAKVEALPVDLLNRSFLIDDSTVAVPETTGQQGSLTSSGDTSAPADAQPTTESASPAATQPPAAEPCILSAGDLVRNIRAAPDINATISGTVPAGESIASQNIVRDAKFSNVYWYEVGKGYMRFDTVIASAGCQPIIDAVYPPAPTPTPFVTSEPTVAASSSQTSSAVIQPGAATAVPTAASTAKGSLKSSDVGEVCTVADGRTASGSIKAGQTDLVIGGTWTVTKGTNVTINVEGVSALRSDYGDIFRVVDSDGNVLLHSQTAKEMTLAFPADMSFEIRVGANEGDLVFLRATCR